MTSPILEVRGGAKSFGAVRALAGVHLTLNEGEILAILGDNGAGKSTLIKCISGVHTFDTGNIIFRGEPVEIRNPLNARTLGIETVYQDLALFDNLTASENFFAGREICRPSWLRRLAWPATRQMTIETRLILERLQVGVSELRTNLALLSGGQRQAIAVARAVAFASAVVILDEPTAALGIRESRNVMDLVSRLPQQGASVILISHNLEEVMQICDRAVVKRNGRVVGEAPPVPENQALLVSLIVGGIAPPNAGVSESSAQH
jgi:D-xylose transport system ATP-binding protein